MNKIILSRMMGTDVDCFINQNAININKMLNISKKI